jgi:hypothetical protein
MTSEKYIKAILYVAVAAWAVVLLAGGQKLSVGLLKPLSTVISIVVFTTLGFDLWLWKLPLLHGWFVKRPVIDGTWKAEIRSNWSKTANGSSEPIAPVEGYVVIRQTFSTLSLRLLTEESSSELVGTEIVCSADGLYCISGVYRNEPRFQVREHSSIHYGAVWLKIIDEKYKRIEGHYWTDRETAGEIELANRKKQKFQDFTSARAYYAQLPTTH